MNPHRTSQTERLYAILDLQAIKDAALAKKLQDEITPNGLAAEQLPTLWNYDQANQQ